MVPGREEVADNLMVVRTEMGYVHITGGSSGAQRDEGVVEGGMPQAICDEGPIRCANTGATDQYARAGVCQTGSEVHAP